VVKRLPTKDQRIQKRQRQGGGGGSNLGEGGKKLSEGKGHDATFFVVPWGKRERGGKARRKGKWDREKQHAVSRREDKKLARSEKLPLVEPKTLTKVFWNKCCSGN